MTELIRNIAGYFPVQDPTWIFFIVLGIILFAPIVFGKLRIPHIIGMILAGMVIGEHGLNIIVRDSSFQLFGNVGLLYIMFLAGMEMDMNDFKQNRNKAIVFGLLGFIVPMAMGYAVNSMLLKYAAVPAMLVASMYASHTLVSYPIVSRYGMARQRSVSISVGATAITDCLTLFLLAILGGLYKDADSGSLLWLWLVVKVALLTACVIIFFPRSGLPPLQQRCAAIHFCAWDDVPQCRSDENRRHGGYPRSVSRRTGAKQTRSKRVYADAQP